jgi:hypothetical protein
MNTVNSPFHCIHSGCTTFPTVVQDFSKPGETRIKIGRIFTCTDPAHQEEGRRKGLAMFQGSEFCEELLPRSLEALHYQVLQTGKMAGRKVDGRDFERLRVYMESKRRIAAEKK